MTITGRQRILIADDHTLFAELCKNLLEPEFQVVGVASNGRAMIQLALEQKPDIVVVDIAMPLLNGLDAGESLKEMFPRIKLVFISMNTDVDLAAEAFRRGGSAFLLKTCTANELVTAVHAVAAGRSYLSSSMSKDQVSYLSRTQDSYSNRDERLTERQREVLQLLCEGKVMKEIGCILNITPRTVAFHKYRLMELLHARSTADLVRYAMSHHVIMVENASLHYQTKSSAFLATNYLASEP